MKKKAVTVVTEQKESNIGSSSLSPVVNYGNSILSSMQSYDEAYDYSLKLFEYGNNNDFDMTLDDVSIISETSDDSVCLLRQQDSATDLDETYLMNVDEEEQMESNDGGKDISNVVIDNQCHVANVSSVSKSTNEDQIPWKDGYKLKLCFANLVFMHRGHTAGN